MRRKRHKLHIQQLHNVRSPHNTNNTNNTNNTTHTTRYLAGQLFPWVAWGTRDRSRWQHMAAIASIATILFPLICLCTGFTTAASAAVGALPGRMDVASDVARPTLTPSTEFGGRPVIYAGAGDGSWPDQMEPNDGPDDLLGPAPVEVGTLYRSLNLLPHIQPAANPAPGEDRDWYVWDTRGGRCYRAFTGDVAGSAGQLTGKWKVQHTIRIWWHPPVKEGRKLLAEYHPGMGPAEGGYFAAASACGEVDGQMAAEVSNYKYALKSPRGATYTFGVLGVGTPAASPHEGGSPSGSPPNNGAGQTPVYSAPVPRPPQPTRPPPPTPTYSPTATSTPFSTSTQPPIPTLPASPAPTLTVSTTPSPRPGTAGMPAAVDVVAYLDQNQNGAPDPGEGLRDLRVALLSVRTNSVQKTVGTNDNGYARLEWTWAGRVRVALPDLNWSDLVDPYDMASASRPRSDVWSTAENGSLYLEVRVLPARLPAVIP